MLPPQGNFTSPPDLASRLREVGRGPTGRHSLERAARYLASRGVEVSSGYLGMLVRGTRTASVGKAREIARVLGLRLSDVVGE